MLKVEKLADASQNTARNNNKKLSKISSKSDKPGAIFRVEHDLFFFEPTGHVEGDIARIDRPVRVRCYVHVETKKIYNLIYRNLSNEQAPLSLSWFITDFQKKILTFLPRVPKNISPEIFKCTEYIKFDLKWLF